MAVGQFDPLLRYIRRLACSGAEGPTDGQLLEQYLSHECEAAFAGLVKRHGPMVHGVCRRVLGNAHDADDALQATFLVLMRQAAKIVRHESVGSWLHGVAYRTAVKAKAAARRRRAMEKAVPVASAADEIPDIAWQELRPILDQEIANLPENYRLPFVLCYLEGKTNVQAANLLRWPLGTVATRLSRARLRLRKRLSRRGAGLAGGLFEGVHGRTAFSARATKGLGSAFTGRLEKVASERVNALAKGVLKTMSMTKGRIATLVLAATTAIGGGAGICVYGAFGGDQTALHKTGFVSPPAGDGGRDERNEVNATRATAAKSVDRPTTYNVECKITDINPDGEEVVMSAPTVQISEGQPARVLVGQNYPIVAGAGKGDTITYEPVGFQMTLKVFERKEGRFFTECFASLTKAQSDETGSTVLRGVTAQSHKVGKLGEPLVLELDKSSLEPGVCRVALTVNQVWPPQKDEAK